MICPQCGNEMADDARYCVRCGASLDSHGVASSQRGDSVERLQTTILTGDYSDFRDTVVDQVVEFDPDAFSGEPPVPEPPASSAAPEPPVRDEWSASTAYDSEATERVAQAPTRPISHQASTSKLPFADDPNMQAAPPKRNALIGVLIGVGVFAVIVLVFVSLYAFGVIGGQTKQESGSSSLPAAMPSSLASSSSSSTSSLSSSSSSSTAAGVTATQRSRWTRCRWSGPAKAMPARSWSSAPP